MTPARSAGVAVARGTALITCVLALVLATAGPALAHGPTPDASNYDSRITGIVEVVDGEPGAAVRPSGVRWRVLGTDALLEIRNIGTAEVVVDGYDGEPYLRVGPQGVYENRMSPATYLNADRFMRAAVPPQADADAAPDWRKVSDDVTWRWHDHRIHWMAPGLPPRVERDATVRQTVFDWSVPFAIADTDLAVQGTLEWIPPGPVWPWLLGAALLVTLPVLVAAPWGRHATVRATGVVLVIVAVAGMVVAVGDVIETPAGIAADAWALVQTTVPAAIAIALVWSTVRRRPTGDETAQESTLVVAAAIIAISVGLVRLVELRSSQIVNALPDWSVRAVVAAAVVSLVAAALAAVIASRAACRVGVR